jgi:hypothetical protein
MQLTKKDEQRFGRPHQYATVTAGTNSTILTINVPESTIAIIKSLANNYFTNTYFLLYIDGELFENAKIERAIGAVNNPYFLPVPVIAKRQIQVIAYNDDTSDHIMEFLIDGVFKLLKEDE